MATTRKPVPSSSYDDDAPAANAPEAAVVGQFAQDAVAFERRVYVVGKGEAAKTFVLIRDSSGGESLKEIDGRGPHMAVAGRVVQAVTLETTDSLVAYLQAWKEQDETVLFASIAADRFVAVLDYHNATEGKAGFGEHVATLQLIKSEEWKAWTQHNGKLLTQLEFVAFLDENRGDVVTPDAATLLELAKDLSANRKVDFRSVMRADSQNMKVEFADSTEAKKANGEILLPTQFRLALPVYFGGKVYNLDALLIWKLDEREGLKLGYKLIRHEKLRQAVFLENATEIAERAGVTVMHGSRGSRGSSD